jgi:hypothetical protein
MKIKLKLLDLDLAIVKLDMIYNPEVIIRSGEFISFTRTGYENSLVLESKYVEHNWDASPGWKAFVIEGTLDFSLVGILNQILTPLANSGIGVFAISTYDTDYVLVKDQQVELAKDVLRMEQNIDLLG